MWRGPRWPRTPGALPEGAPTPAATLNLQPGEWVKVKPHEEILKTVTAVNLNRGMYWDAELVPYCGGTYRVLKRVTKIIDERTGKMLDMKTPCIILDSVVCGCTSCMLCPGHVSYWREIWLEELPGRLVPQSTRRAGGRASVAAARDAFHRDEYDWRRLIEPARIRMGPVHARNCARDSGKRHRPLQLSHLGFQSKQRNDSGYFQDERALEAKLVRCTEDPSLTRYDLRPDPSYRQWFRQIERRE